MKKISDFRVESLRELAPGVFRMTLRGDTSGIERPGQFVNIAVDGFYLRRPISVCDVDGGELTVVFRVVGGGTERLSRYESGDTLSLVSGLGNGYDIDKAFSAPLLVGGGVGIPPLLLLARRLSERGMRTRAVLGFKNSADMFLPDDFKRYGDVLVATEDGSAGKRGFVTGLLDEAGGDYVFACGPEPMLKALLAASPLPAQLSFESRMACGMGACLTCTCHTASGAKRICTDGPVFEREDVIWTQR